MTGRVSICRSIFSLGAVGLVALSASSLAAQLPPAVASQNSTSQPAFEVASIKVNKSGSGSSNSDFEHGRLVATNVSVKSLIQYEGYEIPGPQIIGGPGWLTSERFDIEAKVDDESLSNMDRVSYKERAETERAMVRQLLSDRFHLIVHWDMKEVSVYALVLAKGGPKFAATKETNEGHSGTSSGNGRLAATDVTMGRYAESLTQTLSRELGRIVVDQTGLDGKYDLTLNWSPDNRSGAYVSTASDASAPGPSIFTALPEQLGLKLVSAKAPVKTLVIDHVEQPTEN